MGRGYHRLTVTDGREIRRCRDAGWPIAKIAQHVGCSRDTVKRSLAGVVEYARAPEPRLLARKIKSAVRCKGCGGMIYLWPCLACRLLVDHNPHPDILEA